MNTCITSMTLAQRTSSLDGFKWNSDVDGGIFCSSGMMTSSSGSSRISLLAAPGAVRSDPPKVRRRGLNVSLCFLLFVVTLCVIIFLEVSWRNELNAHCIVIRYRECYSRCGFWVFCIVLLWEHHVTLKSPTHWFSMHMLPRRLVQRL